MHSGEALGWLFAGLVNDHLWAGTYCPECCGPCGTLRDYWTTPRGKADAQTYLSKLSPENRNWYWAPGGVIDWEQVEGLMAAETCPNHEEEKS